MVAVMAVLSYAVFTKTPEQLGQSPDGDLPDAKATRITAPQARALPGTQRWRDRRFLTLALGMAAGLFAQIGLLAHLFSRLVPALGAQAAGLAMGFATACAIAGRMVVARLLPAGASRRVVAAIAYAVQLAGTLVLLFVDGQQTAWILLGVALFGSGIGNATSLPPLMACVLARARRYSSWLRPPYRALRSGVSLRAGDRIEVGPPCGFDVLLSAQVGCLNVQA